MLSVTDIQLSYGRGQEELFGGLSHAFTPARVTAITGQSGRGKSTLLYMLGLVLRPTGGAVVLDDRTVSRLPDRERSALRARSIGFVFQDAVLDPSRTILDAVIEPALYAGVRRRSAALRAQALLEEFGLARRAAHRPGQISGGQAQRVAICRALVNDPQIVLADEPTGNLDRANAAALLGTLRDVARNGRTVIIATHDPFVLEHADETLAL